MPNIKIIDCTTGVEIERDMTEDEIAQHKKDEQLVVAQKKQTMQKSQRVKAHLPNLPSLDLQPMR